MEKWNLKILKSTKKHLFIVIIFNISIIVRKY